MIARFLISRSGATSIEYATIAGMVSILIVTGATGIGNKLNALFLGPLMSGFR
ncbi:Flp family type IVb pilin [Lichenihabitans sp. Uapishka_5]|uniref:Flp family type IVb pilin n=1 Tax=Lichenihabitans sp. Uapishka_5 TaxID=3037302 RepID=UPI0029E7F103|nr:Flp family type IVb pilin [Lichenihabitans sp. Uapishka_5]MDX7951032.1 Flp family type IVb pilin [Lichenihabitans sp. Uapishka_5]